MGRKSVVFGVGLFCVGLLGFVWIFTAATQESVNVDNWVTKYHNITKYRDVTVYRDVNYHYSTWNVSVLQLGVHHVFGMFANVVDAGSFNATSGDWTRLKSNWLILHKD